MRKRITLIISICLVLLFTALSITKASANPKKINPTPDQPITLKMATFFASPKDIRQIYTVKWGEAITKATNGAIKFKYFPGGQLVTAKEMSDALYSGIIDANTWFIPSYTPEDYPFLAATLLVPLALPNNLETFQAFCRDKKVQEILFAPYEQHNIKRCWGMEASYGQEWFLNEPWDTRDFTKNFKKKKIRSSGILAARFFLNYLGAERIGMSAPEIYEAGQKGLIQGCNQGFSQYTHSHVYEVFPYVMFGNTSFNLPGGTPCVIRLDLFNSFPDGIQKTIMDVSRKLQPEFFQAYRAEVDRLLEDLIKKGAIKQFVVLDKETKAKWKKEFDPILDEGMSKKFPTRWPKLRALLNKYQAY